MPKQAPPLQLSILVGQKTPQGQNHSSIEHKKHITSENRARLYVKRESGASAMRTFDALRINYTHEVRACPLDYEGCVITVIKNHRCPSNDRSNGSSKVEEQTRPKECKARNGVTERGSPLFKICCRLSRRLFSEKKRKNLYSGGSCSPSHLQLVAGLPMYSDSFRCLSESHSSVEVPEQTQSTE